MLEVLDMTVVSCDGKSACADFDCWSPRLQQVISVRAEYLQDVDHLVVSLATDWEVCREVALCPRCLADVKEAVLEQLEANRSLH